MIATSFRVDFRARVRALARNVPMVLPLVALLVLVVLAYAPGIHGGFVFDDYQNIVENPAFGRSFSHWRDWMAASLSSPASALQRPLAMASFAANVYFAGLDPAAMKMTNIGIHALNVLLVFLLCKALFAVATRHPDIDGRARWAALFAAACWGLHPINFTAVLFVVQRMESLCHTFVFAGLWLYVNGRRRQRADGSGGWQVLVGLIGATAVGLLCKESAVLLPLYAFGIELFVFRFATAQGGPDRRLHLLYVFALVLPAIAAIGWLLPQALRPEAYATRDFSMGERLLTEGRVMAGYLRWLLLPDLQSLGLYHDDIVVSRGLTDPPATLVALLFLGLLVAAAWLGRKRLPLTALGVFWFLAAQSLTATFIPLELVFEHRNYFASLGICVALAELLLFAPPASWRRITTLAAAGFLLLCGGITTLRANEWSTPIRFAQTEAAKHPRSPRATYEYARLLIILSNYDPRSATFADVPAALERARHAPGSGSLPEQAALMFAARTGTRPPVDAWDRLREEIRRHPGAPQEQLSLIALTNCAIEGLCDLPRDQMLATFAAGLERGPDVGILSTYGKYARYVLGDTDLALRLWEEASRRAPTNPQFQVNLIDLLIELGRLDEASAHIAQLRGLGRLHQFAPIADAFQQRVDARRPRQPAARPARTPG